MMRVKKLVRQAGLVGACVAAAGPGLASPSPATPTHAPVITPLVTPPAPAQPAPGASSTGLVYSAVTVDQVAALLRSKGYKAEIHTIDNVGPVIASGTMGVNYTIFFYGCSTGGVVACKAIQFVAVWKNDTGLTTDDANKCNDRTVFGKLIAFPDKVALTHAAGTEGTSDPYYAAQIDIWEGSITTARQCFVETNHATPPGAKGAATPHADNLPLTGALPGQAPASLATSAIPPSEFNLMPR